MDESRVLAAENKSDEVRSVNETHAQLKSSEDLVFAGVEIEYLPCLPNFFRSFLIT